MTNSNNSGQHRISESPDTASESRAPRNSGRGIAAELNKRGTWTITCDSCGHPGRIEIAMSKAWTNRFGAQAAGTGSGFLKRTWSRHNVRRTQSVNHEEIIMATIHDSQIEPWVLVEGPSSGDAEFTTQWLLAAISADGLLEDYYAIDPSFRPLILGLETMYCIEFVPAAMAFLRKWLKTRSAFSLSLFDSQWTHMFAIMAGVGFFTRTGDRYQITVPKNLMITSIKGARAQYFSWPLPKMRNICTARSNF